MLTISENSRIIVPLSYPSFQGEVKFLFYYSKIASSDEYHGLVAVPFITS